MSRGNDINFFHSNPALLKDTLNGWASASYFDMPADINQTGLSYAHDFKKAGVFGIGIQHLGYGTIQGYDATGMETEKYNAGETALMIAKSSQAGNFRIGATLKGIFSNVAGYNANALAVDIGGVFAHPEKGFTVGMVIKNLGFLLTDYSGTSRSTLPFDVQLGTTFKPEHMPLRFTITAYNLSRWSIAYYDPASTNSESSGLGKLLSHFNFGAEILFHRNFNFLAGYNVLVHKELKLETTGGGAGISLGIAARVRAFEFIVSRSNYVVGSAGYSFTVLTDLKSLITRG